MSTATRTARGQAPASPLQLSWRERLDVLKRAGKQFLADDCMGLAQQVAFSSLLAFLPTVILLIGLLGLFGPGAFDSLERFVGSVAPHGVTDMIALAKQDAAQNKAGSAIAFFVGAGSAIAFVVGAFGAVWAASGAMGAVVKAVNRAYDRIETRPFWKVRLVAIVLVAATGLVTAGMFLLIVFGGSLGDGFKLVWNIARWPIAFTAVLLFFSLVYYLAPNVEHRNWRWVTPGSLVGSVLWLALSGLFAVYTSFSGSYARTYGSIAGAIVLLLWLNYSAWAILFGAELNAELDRRGVEPRKPRAP